MTDLQTYEKVLGQLGEAGFFLSLFGGPQHVQETLQVAWPIRMNTLLAYWADELTEANRLHVIRCIKVPPGLSYMLHPQLEHMTPTTQTALAIGLNDGLERALDRVDNIDAGQLRANYQHALAIAARGQ